LVTVILSVPEVPSVCVPSLRSVVERLTMEAVPTPFRLMTAFPCWSGGRRGFGGSSSVMITEAERTPSAVGVNVRVNMQLDAAGTELPHVLVSRKSPGVVPVRVIPVMAKGFICRLVRVTVCVPVRLRVWMPKSRLSSDSFTAPTFVQVRHESVARRVKRSDSPTALANNSDET
jgi:hypothetical protein